MVDKRNYPWSMKNALFNKKKIKGEWSDYIKILRSITEQWRKQLVFQFPHFSGFFKIIFIKSKDTFFAEECLIMQVPFFNNSNKKKYIILHTLYCYNVHLSQLSKEASDESDKWYPKL